MFSDETEYTPPRAVYEVGLELGQSHEFGSGSRDQSSHCYMSASRTKANAKDTRLRLEVQHSVRPHDRAVI
jgi:hypothetical protein